MELIDQAIALHQAENLSDAEALYRRVLQTDSRDFDALHMLGVICAQQQQLEEAERLIRDALSIDSGMAACHHNYGNVLAKLGRFEDAIDSYDKALAIAPDDALIYSDLGLAQKELGRFDEALASFARALAIDPDFADAHLNLGVCQLLRGDFERGWTEYEWRWQTKDMPLLKQGFQKPLWLGHEDIAGKTILLHAEQGLGDAIQFCRYAELLAAKGAKVILEVEPPLKELLANVRGVRQVLDVGEPPSYFDCHCPLLSLPLAVQTRIDTIPARVPYLEASPDLIKKWSLQLGEKIRPRIGIAWSGSPTNTNGRYRSIELSRLLPLQAPGLQFVSLQGDVSAQDQELLDTHGILHFGGDFPNTAALVSLMDIVISVDTSIAHLAGALGAPTWVLLPFVPDWRWMLDRDDSPWYPTARLFRQPRIGDWDSVVQSVRLELERRI